MKKVRLIFCFVALSVLACGTLMAQKTYQYKLCCRIEEDKGLATDLV